MSKPKRRGHRRWVNFDWSLRPTGRLRDGKPVFDVVVVDKGGETEMGTLHYEDHGDGFTQWVYETSEEWPPGVSQWSVYEDWAAVCERFGVDPKDPSRPAID